MDTVTDFEMNGVKQQQKRPSNKKVNNDDMLLPLLARAANKESRELILKHGGGETREPREIEEKLAELYVKAPDKAEFEKELAEIHPHKNWLMRVLPAAQPIIIQKEVAASADGEETKNTNTGCDNCQSYPFGNKNNDFNNFQQQYSSLDGILSKAAQNSNNSRANILELVALISVVSLAFYFISKEK